MIWEIEFTHFSKGAGLFLRRSVHQEGKQLRVSDTEMLCRNRQITNKQLLMYLSVKLAGYKNAKQETDDISQNYNAAHLWHWSSTQLSAT